jgi:flotillin
MLHTILSSAIYTIPAIVFIIIFIYILSLRRIVSANVVHIVQRGDKTVSYGVGKGTNVYYAFPKWFPIIGVVVRELPVSNFDIDLKNYSAYDKDRVPFVVDVKAFFHIADTNKAAEKVESFEEMKKQLENIVQGAVRSILAKSPLESIMEERSIFGDKFTENVKKDLQNWGVEPIKNIELMDVRDAEGSNVIHQIMAKRISAIDMESRSEVAKNRKFAQQAELEAQKEIDVTAAETQQLSGEAKARSEQAIGIAKAESVKKSGIAEQESLSEIAKSAKATAEQRMEVVKINEIKQAEIDKDKAIIIAEQQKATIEIDAQANKIKLETNAQADKYKVETDASARLEAQKKDAEGIKSIGEVEAEVIKLKGISEAESKKAMELAGVTAQTTLAEKIGENKSYQDYLIRVKEVEVSQIVGVAQYESIAKALEGADLKFLVNSGDVHSGIGKLSDLFTSKGGSQLNGLIESLKQTEEGKGILSMLENFKSKGESKA